MFLKNYYIAIMQILMPELTCPSMNSISPLDESYTTTFTNRPTPCLTGLSSSDDKANIPTMKKVRTDYAGNSGIVFGTGNTPVQFEDYQLSGNLITTVSCSCTLSYEDVTNIQGKVIGRKIKSLITITNTSSSQITIREVGLMTSTSTTTGTVGARRDHILLERTVLEEPVVIPGNGVGMVEYTVQFNLPTVE